MAHFSARANDAVAAAIRGFRAIGHLALRANALSLKFCTALVESRREPMLQLPFVIRRGQPLKVPPPFGHASFRRQDRNQSEGTQLAQRQCHYASSDLIGAAFFLERANDLSATSDIVSRLACGAGAS